MCRLQIGSMVQAALIRYIALCELVDLGVIAGALLARMVHLYGKAETLKMLEKLIDRGEAARTVGKADA